MIISAVFGCLTGSESDFVTVIADGTPHTITTNDEKWSKAREMIFSGKFQELGELVVPETQETETVCDSYDDNDDPYDEDNESSGDDYGGDEWVRDNYYSDPDAVVVYPQTEDRITIPASKMQKVFRGCKRLYVDADEYGNITITKGNWNHHTHTYNGGGFRFRIPKYAHVSKSYMVRIPPSKSRIDIEPAV